MKTKTNISQSIEDYLKAIYDIAGDKDKASTSELSQYLEVTPASISGMIKKLASMSPPLVKYQKHQGVSLTKDGLKIAVEMVRHHRLIEMFLHKILGYPWDEVHEEAERLEHAISEKFEERIAAVLNNPDFDPHGDPIPSQNLSIPITDDVSLFSLDQNQNATVSRVRDTDAKLLRYLSTINIIPGAKIKVVNKSPFDENLTLMDLVTKKSIVLGKSITEQIFVVPTVNKTKL
jgi:DtxR family transcriptional regulator, Mn-dependent transcriptional regulator